MVSFIIIPARRLPLCFVRVNYLSLLIPFELAYRLGLLNEQGLEGW